LRIAVLKFPGSNCDQDAFHALRDDLGIQADYVWQDETSLAGFDGVFVPGGFSYGDYLRCGAMASRSLVMDEVRRFAKEGRPVIGACNGFQVLCESGILPGALLRNVHEKFVCQDVFLRAETRRSPWTEAVDRIIRIPIAHGEGRYVADADAVKRLEDQDQIAFRYVNAAGELDPISNVNGSTDAIAGVLNEKGNVLGLMPHPERASRTSLGSVDGLTILKAFELVSA
jgi:phosphoribosylformylglycinamidine synthase